MPLRRNILRKPRQIPSLFISFEREITLGKHDASLDTAVAAIDAQVWAGHEPRGVTGKVDNGTFEVIGFAHLEKEHD